MPYELHYSVALARARGFLRAACGRGGAAPAACTTTAKDSSIDFEGLLASQPLGTHVYVCGPAGMIKRVIDTARALRLARQPHSLGAILRAAGRRRLRCVPRELQHATCTCRRTRACWRASRRPASMCPTCAAAASAASAIPRARAATASWCTTIIFSRMRKSLRQEHHALRVASALQEAGAGSVA